MSSAVWVMRCVCRGKGMTGALAVMALLFVKDIIPNVVAAAVYAYRMRNDIAPVKKESEQDSFMQTIANSGES